jgi:hypothetical protein
LAAYDIVWYGPGADAPSEVGAEPRWIGVQEPPPLVPDEEPPEDPDVVPLDVPPPSSSRTPLLVPPPSSPLPPEPLPPDELKPELVPELE